MWLVTQEEIEGENGEEVTFEDILTKKASKTNLQKLLTQSNCSKDPKQHKYKIFPL